MQAAYGADPTFYPGASNVSWVFHVAFGFTASAPSASIGTANVNGADVTWMIPSLDAAPVTLTFHAVHNPAAGCAATALLSGTTFSDSDGDAGPAAGLGPLTVSGCPPVSPPPRKTLRITSVAVHGKSIGTGGGVTLTLVLNRAGTVKIRFERRTVGRRVHGRCVTQTHENRHRKSCMRLVVAGTLTRSRRLGASKSGSRDQSTVATRSGWRPTKSLCSRPAHGRPPRHSPSRSTAKSARCPGARAKHSSPPTRDQRWSPPRRSGLGSSRSRRRR